MPWTAPQHRLFALAAHDPGVARARGIPQVSALRMMKEGVKHLARGGLAGKQRRQSPLTDMLQGLWDTGAGALRGTTATALGLPGDLEHLIRMAAQRTLEPEDQGRYLRTTDDWLDALPPTGRDTKVTEGLGANLLGLTALGNAVPSSLGALGRLGRIAARNRAVPRGASFEAGAIKPKGGNWRQYDIMEPEEIERRYPGRTPEVVRELGEGRKTGTTSGLDVNLQSLKDSHIGDFHEPNPRLAEANPQASALLDWTNKNLRRYLQTHWGSPDDPLADFMVAETRAGRAPGMGAEGPDVIHQDFFHRYGNGDLANTNPSLISRFDRARGVTEPDPRDFFTGSVATQKAKHAYPLTGPQPKGKTDFRETMEEYYPESAGEFRAPPWAMKLDPEAPIHDLDIGPGGFSDTYGNQVGDVYDYLRTLPPERVKNVSVPDAFRSAKEYHDRLRAKEQGGLGEQLRALTPVKEYPTGHRWVDLNEGFRGERNAELDPAFERTKTVGKALGHCYQHPETCASYLNSATLRTLIDEKGKPLVTAEIRRTKAARRDFNDSVKVLGEKRAFELLDEFKPVREKPGVTWEKWLEENHPDDFSKIEQGPQSIHQLRATQNSAPTEDLYPFVQDLVKSGDWADVHEARNAGLFQMKDPTEALRQKLAREFKVNSHSELASLEDAGDHWANPETGELISKADAERAFQPWKRPAAWVTPEDVLPYARFRDVMGDKNNWVTGDRLTQGPGGVGTPQNNLELLRQLLGREGRSDRARFDFPPDFEGFAKGGQVRARTSAYVPIARTAAEHHGLPPGLLESLIDHESNWNSDAVSPRGATGMTQLMPPTAKELGVTDPRNPVDNIYGGAKYLRKLKDQFGTWDQALAAYNWGPGNLQKYGMAKAPAETRGYIGRVLAGLDMSALPSPAKGIIMAKLAAGEAPPPAFPGMPAMPQPDIGPEMGPGIQHDPEVEALLASLLNDDDEELI